MGLPFLRVGERLQKIGSEDRVIGPQAVRSDLRAVRAQRR
jgi:hypothetical protein